jgi:hypothetical protein
MVQVVLDRRSPIWFRHIKFKEIPIKFKEILKKEKSLLLDDAHPNLLGMRNHFWSRLVKSCKFGQSKFSSTISYSSFNI